MTPPVIVGLFDARGLAADTARRLASVLRAVDSVVALTDGQPASELASASDLLGTIEARGDQVHDRNAMLSVAATVAPAWIVSFEQGESLSPDDAVALRQFTEVEALPGCAYGFAVYDSELNARSRSANRFWVYRLFAWEPGQKFDGHACGPDVIPSSIPRSLWLKTHLRIEQPSDRAAQNRRSDPDRGLKVGRPPIEAIAAIVPPTPLAVDVRAKPQLRIEPRQRTRLPTPFAKVNRFRPRPLAIRGADSELLEGTGITHQLAGLSTSFHMFAPPMATNIAVAARILSSVQILPGGVFSLNRTIGPITTERGFVEGRVIAGGRIGSDIGGGLCAVSTLIFRAALLAGLPFTRWNPHILRLPFYEQAGWPPGIDATFYQPDDETTKLIDLRFSNPTASTLLVQVSVTQKLISAEIFGPDTGFEIELDGPALEPGATARTVERKVNWLPSGRRREVQESEAGLKSNLVRTVTRSGTIVSERAFVSVYRPQIGIVLVGVGAQASPGSHAGNAPASADVTT